VPIGNRLASTMTISFYLHKVGWKLLVPPYLAIKEEEWLLVVVVIFISVHGISQNVP